MVWHFIGVYIINRTLHDRLEIRNFSSRREISYLRAAMQYPLYICIYIKKKKDYSLGFFSRVKKMNSDVKNKNLEFYRDFYGVISV